MAGVDGLVDAVTRWYLSEGLTRDLGETIEAGRDGFEKLAAAAPEVADAERRRERAGDRRAAGRRGVPEGLPRPTRCARGSSTPRRSSRWRAHRAAGRGRGAGVLHRRRPAAARRARGRARHRPGQPAGCSAGRSRPCARTPAAPAARSPSTRSWRRPSAGPEEAVSDYLAAHSRTAGGSTRSCARSRGRPRTWPGSRRSAPVAGARDGASGAPASGATRWLTRRSAQTARDRNRGLHRRTAEMLPPPRRPLRTMRPARMTPPRRCRRAGRPVHEPQEPGR